MPTIPKAKRPSYLPKRNGNDRSHNVHKQSRWRRTSIQQRTRQPECEVCLHVNGIGQVGDRLHVDHIVGLKQGGAAYDTRNLMTMCVTHHGRKSSMEARGYVPLSRDGVMGLIPIDRVQVIRDVIGGDVGGDTDPHPHE